MKLTSQSIQQLKRLINISSQLGIDALIIDETQARGINDDKTAVMLVNDNLPQLGGPAGLSRASMLLTRLQLVGDEPVVDTKITETNEVGSFEISGPGVKTTYRAAAQNVIKAPKDVRDPLSWQFQFNKETLAKLVAGSRAMGAKKININTRDGNKVFAELVDTNQDAFTIELAEGATWIRTDKPAPGAVFVHTYAVDTVLNMLKLACEDADQFNLMVGEAGTLQVIIPGGIRLIAISYVGE